MLYIPNLLLLLVKRIWVFFFISAYLLGMKEIHKSNVLSFLKKKTLVIFVPFLSWTFLVKPLFFIDEFLQEVPGGLSILKQISGKLNLLRINNNGEHEAINVRMDISKQDENYEIHLSIEDDYFPYPKLLAQQNIDIPYLTFSNDTHHTVRLTWDVQI